ncbi:MAG: helix-turn-helix domain-containing protein [Nanobdellota archaeon]
MAECYKCGVSDERERLFDAISNKGLVKICKHCSGDEDLPLIQPVDLNKPEKTKSVYERLSAMANLDPEKHKKVLAEKAQEDSLKRYRQNREKIRQDTSLKSVIDSRFEKNKPQPRTDLVPNFHWVIMRARRSKKLTQKQLAENIGEPENLIVSAESGTIFANAESLVRKLENYLGIKLRKGESEYSSTSGQSKFVKPGIAEDPERREIREKFEKEGKFDSKTTENLTIGDLKEIDKKKESEGSKGFFSFFKRKKKSEVENTKDEEELSEEETNEILYGK